MVKIPSRLREVADQPEPETVRTLLAWFDAQRRGHFGEYERLLENPDHWERLGLIAIDRKTFKKQLENIRLVRNSAMHFDSDGLADEDLETLRRFAGLLRKLHKMGEV